MWWSVIHNIAEVKMSLTFFLALFLVGVVGLFGIQRKQYHHLYLLLAFPLKLVLNEVKMHGISSLFRREGKKLRHRFMFGHSKLLILVIKIVLTVRTRFHPYLRSGFV